LGCSLQRAHRIIVGEFERLTRERAEAAQALVSQEAERLERLHRAHWDKALTGDLDATDRIIKLMNRRAKLLGLDVPTTMNVGVNKIAAPLQVIVEEVASGTEPVQPAPGPAPSCTDTIPSF
jgi:hypothetical protein